MSALRQILSRVDALCSERSGGSLAGPTVEYQLQLCVHIQMCGEPHMTHPDVMQPPYNNMQACTLLVMQNRHACIHSLYTLPHNMYHYKAEGCQLWLVR